MMAIQKVLAWATAFASVFAFYAHTVLGMPSYEVTPLSAAAVATGLVAMAYFGSLPLAYTPVASPARWLSSVSLLVALLFAFASTVIHAFADQVTMTEWGVAGVTFGVPILIGFCGVREELLKAIGVICLIFASVDLAFDVLD
jgi:hypothetical protein